MTKAPLTYAIIYVIALAIAVAFRLFPLLSFSKSDAKERASLYVVSQIKNNIDRQVQQTYPEKSASQQKIIAKQLLDQYLREKRESVRNRIDQVGKELSRQLKGGRSTPYLLASDSYYYFGLTKNILKTGRISDQIKGSKYFNALMLAPNGFWEPLNLHPFIGAFVYKLLAAFSPGIDLMFALSFTPLLLSALCLLVFLLILHHFRLHPAVIFTACIFFMLAPIFMKRSMFGWYDNDPYNILFPLTVLYFFFLSLSNADQKKKWVVYACLSVLAVGGYAFFWQGWVFTFSIVVLSCLGIIIAETLCRDIRYRKERLTLLAILLGGSFIWTTLTFGPKEFIILFSEGLRALSNFLTPQLSAWPDLYISVSELHQSNLTFLMNQLGGPFFLSMALIGFFFLCTKNFSGRRYISITLLIYAGAAVCIALGAQRFVMLTLIPFALSFALGLEALWRFVQNRCKDTSLQKLLSLLFIAAIIATISLPIVWLKNSAASLLNPIFNQTWEEILVAIEEKTPEEAIINTWWPPGHFIKAVAQRRVTFDGATINVPQAYWMANVFLSQSEEEALGLLRMLNTSGNEAVERFTDLGLDLPTSVLAVKDLVKRSRQEAYDILLKVFKSYVKTDEVLALTHGHPAPSYILIYNEFVENNIQLKFIGHWNFKAMQMLNDDPEQLKKVPKRNSPEFVQFLWTLAGGAYKYSGPLAQISSEDTKMIFQENVLVDKKTLTVYVDSSKFGKGIPQSLFFLKDGTVRERKLPGANLSYSIVLYERNALPNVVLLDRALAQSMLIQLYFFEGAGLKYIKPFLHKRDLTGRTDIYVFEIDWPKFIQSADKKS